jgi:hypothetical protein
LRLSRELSGPAGIEQGIHFHFGCEPVVDFATLEKAAPLGAEIGGFGNDALPLLSGSLANDALPFIGG